MAPVSPPLAFLAGVATVPAGFGVVLLWLIATERTSYMCRRCGWSTGWTGALSAWIRIRWHRHGIRRFGRCPA